MKAAELLVKCLENERCRIHLRHSGRGEHRRDGRAARQPDPLRHDPPRAGRGLHGRRLRPPDRPRRRLPGDARPGRDQPDHRRGRRQHGPRAGGGHRRPGRDDAAAQGKPPDPRPGEHVPADHQVRRRRSSSPEIVPEIVRKAFKVAQTEKPGAAFIDFPENVAAMEVDKTPIPVQTAVCARWRRHAKIDEAATADQRRARRR